MERLDNALEQFGNVKSEYGRQTDSIRQRLTAVLSDEDADSRGVCEVYDALFKRYLYTNADSAILYAKKRVKHSHDTIGRAVGYYNLAKAYITKGHETDAFEALVETFPDTGNVKVKPHYYELMIFRKNMLGENPEMWFRRLRKVSVPGTRARVISEAVLSEAEGDASRGIRVIERFLQTNDSSPRFKAVAYLTKGRLQLQAGDTAKAIKSLCEASLLDLTIPTYRYRALSELSLILARTYDSGRAYEYMHFANDNINAAGIMGDIVATNGMMSEVVKIYETNQKMERRIRISLICILSAVSVLLVISVFLIMKSHARTKDAKERLREANSQLSEKNSQLSVANAKLTSAYTRMKEIDNVKTAYLIQYMRQCAVHMDSLDKFRGKLQATARAKGLKGVEEILRKSDHTAELLEFYDNFDKTFLRLFPDFIEEFNKLLKPDCQTGLSNDGTMPNELRAFALIRLGITDSSRIAEFLRRSVSTVYNYRVKMRNNAICPREDFEKRVSEIMSTQ
ncbi:DUF6377 domain-containing protein [uncultured Bacteroides sp.]|uniref:DUF6377 domain-containing protein n=1 Tax=uncultured Bacteroides sp. TaxID=162156 RepID=UPI002675C6AA|nr:DUF6377 domain-containing protein [uncultured Bacteroides sp.]